MWHKRIISSNALFTISISTKISVLQADVTWRQHELKLFTITSLLLWINIAQGSSITDDISVDKACTLLAPPRSKASFFD